MNRQASPDPVSHNLDPVDGSEITGGGQTRASLDRVCIEGNRVRGRKSVEKRQLVGRARMI